MQTSAASRVLCSYELSSMILAPFAIDGRKELANLGRFAQICRGCMEPALDLLWCKLDGLPPIIGLLPSGLVRRIEIDRPEKRPRMTRKIHSEEWKRVLFYTRRVKRIVIGGVWLVEVRAASILIELVPDRPTLLPKIKSLEFSGVCSDALAQMMSFCGTEVTEIFVRNTFLHDYASILDDSDSESHGCDEISCTAACRPKGHLVHRTNDFDAFLSTLLKNNDRLRVLHFSLDYGHPHLPDVYNTDPLPQIHHHLAQSLLYLPHTIRQCQQLVEVNLDMELSLRLLIELSRLPHLKRLNLFLGWVSSRFGTPPSLSHTPFPALESLTLNIEFEDESCAAQVNVLRGISCFARKEIYICGPLSMTIQDVPRILQNLIHPTISANLETFCLWLDNDNDEDDDDEYERDYVRLPFHTFRPLLSCHELKTVAIYGPSVLVEATNSDICDIVEAWPKLHNLTFGANLEAGEAIGLHSAITYKDQLDFAPPDLRGLAALSRCAHLQSLQLFFVVSNDEEEEYRMPSEPSVSPLIHMDVCHSLMDCGADVSEYVAHLFPKLSELCYGASPISHRWTALARDICEIRLREFTRRRMQSTSVIETSHCRIFNLDPDRA